MVRTRQTGGIVPAAQYLVYDELSGRFANGTLRITSRQTFQFHGVAQQGVGNLIKSINEALSSTLATCGDVNRNVTAPSNPPVDDITQQIEDAVAGVQGIQTITSTSQDGTSNINIEFDPSRDIDSAANDVRDRISGAARNLPDEADPPEVTKADSSEDVVLWLSLTGDDYSLAELTDYATAGQ